MKSHSIPSLLGIAAVLIAALVVAIAFGVATDSPTAQAQGQTQSTTTMRRADQTSPAAQLDAVRLYDRTATERRSGPKNQIAAYEAAFPNPAELGSARDPDNRATCTWATS